MIFYSSIHSPRGCWHASWAGLNALIEDDDGSPVDVLVPFASMSELEIQDTWFVAGMCGTGSNTLVARDIFVPEHRLLWTSKVFANDSTGREQSNENSDHHWFASANSVISLAPPLGIAQVMVAKVIEGANKPIAFTTYTRQADSSVAQHELAEAALKVDSASLLALQAADEIELSAASGVQMEYLARARIRGLTGFSTLQLREAVDILMSLAGASGFREEDSLQRMWRDAEHLLWARNFGYRSGTRDLWPGITRR